MPTDRSSGTGLRFKGQVLSYSTSLPATESDRISEGTARLQAARTARAESRTLVDVAAAEARLREALRLAAGAFDWLEDTGLEDEAHDFIHEAGREARERFPDGCRLVLEDSDYWQECPASLVHTRLGLSPGIVLRVGMCSICGHDPSACEHRPGQVVSVRGGPGPSGYCPICLEMECAHSPDELYRATPGIIWTDADLREISLVPQPRDPDARVTSVELSADALQKVFGPAFRHGRDHAPCFECTLPCGGLHRFEGDPQLTEAPDGIRADG